MSEAGPSAAASVNIQVDTPESAVEVEISSEQPQRVRNRVRTQAGQTTDDGGAAASRMSQTSPLGPAFLSERRGTFEKFLKRLSLFDVCQGIYKPEDFYTKRRRPSWKGGGRQTFEGWISRVCCKIWAQILQSPFPGYQVQGHYLQS